MKLKIVKVEIIDSDADDDMLAAYYLVNPAKSKLNTLKKMIEHRFDYMTDEDISDAEIERAEKFCDNIWANIELFIRDNFVVIDINETYKIEY